MNWFTKNLGKTIAYCGGHRSHECGLHRVVSGNSSLRFSIMAAARGNVQYYCTEHLALPVTLMSSLSILKKKKNQAGPRAPTRHMDTPFTVATDPALPRNTGGGARMGSGQQSGVLEVPARPKSTPPEHS